MNWMIVWPPDALQLLSKSYLEIDDTTQFTAACNYLEAALSLAPLTVGVALLDEVRSLVAPPIGVMFKCYESDRIVLILRVWRIPTKP